MVSAEDIVRRRQASDIRQQMLLQEAEQRNIEQKLDRLRVLASKIRDELDRISWPGADIQPVRHVRDGEWFSIASWPVPHLDTGAFSRVGSDGLPYIYGDSGTYESEGNAYRDQGWFVPVVGYVTLAEVDRLLRVYENALETLRRH